MQPLDGDAIVWCDGAFTTPEGKTAHGLVRHTRRYRVRAVVDAPHAGQDAGEALGGRPAGIPVVASFHEARALAPDARYFVIGIAPDGGRLTDHDRAAIAAAIAAGMNIDSGLHDFVADDPRLAALAGDHGVQIRDVRRPRPVGELHHFSGRIDTVGSFRVAVLGTDSAVGKRTTAVLLRDAFAGAGLSSEMIGTGQTAWMQGHRFQVVMDSLINDFVAGELEHAALRCWDEARPDTMVVEGQGSLMNPAYPGGFEILAATRPHAIVLQHAPARVEYDGFPGFPIQPLDVQIRALELISGRPVVAITVNHESLTPDEARAWCARIEAETGLPTCAPLIDGLQPVVERLLALRAAHLRAHEGA